MTSTSPYTGNMEPSLRQVLADPIVLRLMASDQVPMTALVLLLTEIGAGMAARADTPLGRLKSGGPDQPIRKTLNSKSLS